MSKTSATRAKFVYQTNLVNHFGCGSSVLIWTNGLFLVILECILLLQIIHHCHSGLLYFIFNIYCKIHLQQFDTCFKYIFYNFVVCMCSSFLPNTLRENLKISSPFSHMLLNKYDTRTIGSYLPASLIDALNKSGFVKTVST